jgi:hypothetical protein
MLPDLSVAKQKLLEVLLGLRLSVVGLRVAWHNPQLRSKQKRSTISLILILLLVYILVLLWFLPVHFVLWLLSLGSLVDATTISAMQDSLSATALLRALVWFLPLTVLYIFRTFLGFEDEFFGVLSDVNPELSSFLRAQRPRSLTTQLAKFARRTAIVVSISLALRLGRLIPYVGAWVPALWLVERCRSLVLHSQLAGTGMRFALVGAVFVLGFVPLGEWLSMTCLQLSLASTALSRELLEPYFTRIRRDVDHRAFLAKHYCVLLGFGVPYVLLFSIPIAGLLCAWFANGAAASLLSDLIAMDAPASAQLRYLKRHPSHQLQTEHDGTHHPHPDYEHQNQQPHFNQHHKTQEIHPTAPPSLLRQHSEGGDDGSDRVPHL